MLALCPWVCQHLPNGVEMFLCVSGSSKRIWCMGSQQKLRYWPATPPCICWTQPSFWVLALCPWVCQHLPSGLKMFLCISGTSKKIGVWGPNRSWDIDLPFPHVFAQLSPVLDAGTVPTVVSTPPKWSKNVPLCLRNLQKKLVHVSTMRSEHNSISEVPTPDPQIP